MPGRAIARARAGYPSVPSLIRPLSGLVPNACSVSTGIRAPVLALVVSSPCSHVEVLSIRATREQIQQEALDRATNRQTLSNWPAIFAGFTAKGIPESAIKPR